MVAGVLRVVADAGGFDGEWVANVPRMVADAGGASATPLPPCIYTALTVSLLSGVEGCSECRPETLSRRHCLNAFPPLPPLGDKGHVRSAGGRLCQGGTV